MGAYRTIGRFFSPNGDILKTPRYNSGLNMDVHAQILLYTFFIGLAVGGVANKTNFCTMGAVSDLVNMGDSSRMRAWFLAMATAIAGVTILNEGWLDVSLAAAGDTGKPPYLTPNFVWPRYILGGLLFGVGMTLASGCGNKTLVRIGGGNIKSILVFLVMGAAAYLMIYTDFGYTLFLSWMQPLAVNFAHHGLDSQSVAGPWSHLVVGLVTAAVILAWVFSSKDFRGEYVHIGGAAVIGVAVVLGWLLTAGGLGQSLLEELEFLDTRPYDVGAQSLTFVKPTAHFYYWIRNGFAAEFVSFAMVASGGVIVGSAVYALVGRAFRVEWFNSWSDFIKHCAGAFLMGVGGVLSLGCTFGQALSGASTLALGSFLTVASIIVGAAATMKAQFAIMMRE